MVSTKIICRGPAWKTFSVKTIKFSEANSPMVYNWTATENLLEIGREKINYAKKTTCQTTFLRLGRGNEKGHLRTFRRMQSNFARL